MTTTQNTTEQHQPDCRTNDEPNHKGFDWGCTCNWTDEDQHEMERWTD